MVVKNSQLMFRFKDCSCDICTCDKMPNTKVTKRTGVSKSKGEQALEYAANRKEAERMEMEEKEDTDDGSMSHLKRPRRNRSHVTQTIDSSTSEEEDSSNSQELSDDEDEHSLKSSSNSRASGRTKSQQQERRKVKQANGKLLSRRPHGSSPERRFWCPEELRLPWSERKSKQTCPKQTL